MTSSDTPYRVRKLYAAAPRGNVGRGILYTIATLVNDAAQYNEMVESFAGGGFAADDCEFLYIDNTGKNQTCAYEGLNAALNDARGQYVILCHQDVRLLDDGRLQLDNRLGELDDIDPAWAVVGNAGGIEVGKLAIRISDPHGADQHIGDFPQQVSSVDENFLVVKRASRVGFSNDLSGYHLYGADLCLNADVMGWHAYVIDFHLAHLSPGVKNETFGVMEQAFRTKWERALSSRFVQTTCTLLRVGGGSRLGPVRRLWEFIAHKIVRAKVHLKSFKQRRALRQNRVLRTLPARRLQSVLPFWSPIGNGRRNA